MYLRQVGKNNSWLLSQPRLGAVMLTSCRVLHFFSQPLCAARVRGERELNLGTGVEQGMGHKEALHALSVLTALKHHLCHVLLYLWGALVPSSPGSSGSNGAGAFWAAHNPVLQGCSHPSFREAALRHSFKLHTICRSHSSNLWTFE